MGALLAFFGGLKTWAQVGIGGLVGVLLCFSAMTLYVDFVELPAARTAAVAEATTAANKLAAQRQATQQAKIDKIERDYLNKDANATGRIAALEDALSKAKQDAQNPQSSGPDHSACPGYAIPRGVSDRLNDIGR